MFFLLAIEIHSAADREWRSLQPGDRHRPDERVAHRQRAAAQQRGRRGDHPLVQ